MRVFQIADGYYGCTGDLTEQDDSVKAMVEKVFADVIAENSVKPLLVSAARRSDERRRSTTRLD